MAMNDTQGQAMQNTGAMADTLAGRTDSWGSIGPGMVAESQLGQEQAGPPKGAA
ncbi:hypothetical protein CVIRNUC_009213 [Coccomyxa viridis]|uniref:Uncharacterized protein n=1 Tax=Coccomyxa viridis TaxID=1274662 RepID=A0AAV1IIF9_9CHLO|nr:hypothetical protein CVIRNUC_009213 [Coccomyxa viridis]